MSAESKSSSAPSHVRGLLNPDRGFTAGHALLAGVRDCSASAGEVAAMLNRAVTFVDAQGYSDGIIAGAVSDDGRRIAWLQCRAKELHEDHVDISFRLRSQIDGKHHVDWNPRTYNPYFGINPLAFEWDCESLVFAYSEKHHIYRAIFDAVGTLQLDRAVGKEFIPADEADRREREKWAAAQNMDPPYAWLTTTLIVVLCIMALAGGIVAAVVRQLWFSTSRGV